MIIDLFCAVRRASASTRAGSALILTLSALALVTMIVLAYSALVSMERISANSSLEVRRARQLCNMATDEAMVKLRDNIPLDRHWAAAPGRLYLYDPTSSPKPWKLVELHSGKASTSTTGKVALNENMPLSTRPILSPNTEHPNPDPMEVAWINILEDGTLSTAPDYATKISDTNRIVGRYAYWMDIETGKANINTAGRAKTTFSVVEPRVGDVQNLTGHPGRVDLSKLDDAGGAISADESRSTYNYTASSYWADEETLISDTAPPPKRQAPNGMKRFNSLRQWGVIPGVTAEKVEANKFNITTLARAPELNPWGLNKWWWQAAPAHRSASVSTGNTRPNVMNGQGLPLYPGPEMTVMDTYFYTGNNADTRYYVHPAYLGKATTAASTTTFSSNMQWFGSNANYFAYSGSPNKGINFQQYMNNFMKLMNRKDWPGMPARSFVDKYGSDACEDLAINLIYLFDSTVGGGGAVPNCIANGASSATSMYATTPYTYTRPDGTTRLLTGSGSFSFINEVAMQFTPNMSGAATSGAGPGFSQAVTAANYGADFKKYSNVRITPVIELYRPLSMPGRNRAYIGGNNSTLILTNIELAASGIYNGVPVTYAGPNYVWGLPDDRVDDLDTGSSYASGGLRYWNPGNWVSSSGSRYFVPNAAPTSFSMSAFYIGPFDVNTSAQITVKCNAVYSQFNRWTFFCPIQIVPMSERNDKTPDSPSASTKLTFTADVFVDSILKESVYSSRELNDPRVFRYPGDWQKSIAGQGHTLGAVNSVFQSTQPDPVTGAIGDSSKLAMPNVFPITLGYANTSDPRCDQSASHISTFPGIGWLSLACLPNDAGKTPGIPWRTLNFGPATDANNLPDWLLLDIFAMAYDQTYLSQTQGQINPNAQIYPFNFTRLAPLKALLIPSSANATTDSNVIAKDIASYTGINSGPCSNLPNDMFVYVGQICQVASMQGTGATQFEKEALIRDLAGLITTKCSDFKVHVIAQTLNKAGEPTSTQRMSAIISRVTDVGPDGIPGTADDFAGPDRVVGTADDISFKAADGTKITTLAYNGNDKPLEEFAGRPPFRFEITRTEWQTRYAPYENN